MLPNLMPPAECHSPIDEYPSPPDDAPPPGRAWNRCQMNCRPLRGFSPWIAIRKRRPQPAIARSGHDCDIALTIASTISFDGWLVHSVTGRPGSAHTTVPCFAITLRGRSAPEFLGMSASIRKAKAIEHAACMLA